MGNQGMVLKMRYEEKVKNSERTILKLYLTLKECWTFKIAKRNLVEKNPVFSIGYEIS